MARITTTATITGMSVREETNPYSRLRELRATIFIKAEDGTEYVTFTTANINKAKEAKGEARTLAFTPNGREWAGKKVVTRLAIKDRKEAPKAPEGHSVEWVDVPAHYFNDEVLYPAHRRGVCVDCGETFVE